jgi:hypothetical protein
MSLCFFTQFDDIHQSCMAAVKVEHFWRKEESKATAYSTELVLLFL